MPPSSPSAAPLSKALTLTITVKQQICASRTCSTRFSMRVRSYLKKKKKITLLLRARRFNPPCGEPRATNHAQTCANVLFTPHFLGGLKSCIPPHPLQTTPSPLYLNQEAPRHVFFLFLFFYPFLLSCLFFYLFFVFTEPLRDYCAGRTIQGKIGVIVDVVDDHRWKKTDSRSHPVRGSAVDAFDTDKPEKGMCTVQLSTHNNTVQGEKKPVLKTVPLVDM